MPGHLEGSFRDERIDSLEKLSVDPELEVLEPGLAGLFRSILAGGAATPLNERLDLGLRQSLSLDGPGFARFPGDGHYSLSPGIFGVAITLKIR